MKTRHTFLAALGCLCLCTTAFTATPVPNLINYQGRVAVGNPPVNFKGSPYGFFKFALVNAAGDTTYWSNDGTSTVGSQLLNEIRLPVTNGLYSVLLGDTSLTGTTAMAAIPVNVWKSSDLHLRVWFDTQGWLRPQPQARFPIPCQSMAAAT